jgi:hypothetical protein
VAYYVKYRAWYARAENVFIIQLNLASTRWNLEVNHKTNKQRLIITVGSSQCLWNQPLMRMDHSMDMAEMSMFSETADRPYLVVIGNNNTDSLFTASHMVWVSVVSSVLGDLGLQVNCPILLKGQ